MLSISKQKLANVIWHAKKFEENNGHWDQVVHGSFQEDMASSHDDDLSPVTTRSELTEIVDELSEAEKISLIAVSMVGRGTVEADQFDKAIALAKTEVINRAGNYLLGIPMVGDYLEEGLDKLSYLFDDVTH